MLTGTADRTTPVKMGASFKNFMLFWWQYFIWKCHTVTVKLNTRVQITHAMKLILFFFKILAQTYQDSIKLKVISFAFDS
jgi:uncharacterized protein YsxB (DUF464 family)